MVYHWLADDVLVLAINTCVKTGDLPRTLRCTPSMRQTCSAMGWISLTVQDQAVG